MGVELLDQEKWWMMVNSSDCQLQANQWLTSTLFIKTTCWATGVLIHICQPHAGMLAAAGCKLFATPQLRTMDHNFRDYRPQTNIALGNLRKQGFLPLKNAFKPFIACWIKVRLLYQTLQHIIPRLHVWYGQLSIHRNSFQNVVSRTWSQW